MTESGWGDTPCWGCGSTGDHPTLGGHYWPCGTMKCASIRGEWCYETELAALKSLVREMGNKLLLSGQLLLKIKEDGYRPKDLILEEITGLLNRPEVRTIMEEE